MVYFIWVYEVHQPDTLSFISFIQHPPSTVTCTQHLLYSPVLNGSYFFQLLHHLENLHELFTGPTTFFSHLCILVLLMNFISLANLRKKHSVCYQNSVFPKCFFHVINVFITLNAAHQCPRSWHVTFQSFVTCNLRRPDPNIQESFIPSGPHEESLYCPHFCPPVHQLCHPDHHSLSCACSTLGFAYPVFPNISKFPLWTNPQREANSTKMSH
jgi:hypothetical protein